ncbi:putative glycolipid-binding domain-containing protein [Chitinophagaceae bacterium LWZ2-11]
MNTTRIVWKNLYANTMEIISVNPGDFISVDGAIVGEFKGEPINVQYHLEIDNDWTVQNVAIHIEGDSPFQFIFEKNEEGNWSDKNGRILPALNDCIDIDISLTPFTNTLPIKRLRLTENESKEITVLYLNLLTREYSPIKQRYTNIDGKFYKYENLSSDYTAILEIDEAGYVVNYPGIWQRVYPSNA